MKVRMASTDVAAEVACLKNKLLGMRMANIYDLNAKTYVLKMSKSGGEGDKVFLLLESGSRFHTTELMREKADVPSNFTLKLRKHLRTRRLEDVRQLGVDRIVDFVFGCGQHAMHLILEMYSQGNIVLTNAHYDVLTLLRSHRDDDKGFAVMARHPYPMQHVRLHQTITMEQLATALQSPGPEPGTNLKAALASSVLPYGPTIAEHVVLDAGLDPNLKLKPMQPAAAAPATNGDAGDGGGAADGGPQQEGGAGGEEGGVTEGGAKEEGIAGDVSGDKKVEEGEGGAGVGEGGVETTAGTGGSRRSRKQAGKGQPATAEQRASWRVIGEAELAALHRALLRLDAWFAGLEAQPPVGVITCIQPGAKQLQQQQKSKKKQDEEKAQQGKEEEKEELPVVYNDFNPLMLKQLEKAHNIVLPNFDQALDEFYGKIEGQRAALARAEAERNAMSKVEKIKADQEARVQSLANVAEEAELRANLIQYNLDAVDAAIKAVNEMLATGMDWHDLDVLIKDEHKAGNPVAQLIHSLQLDNNHITLLLSNYLDTEDEGDEAANTRKATKVSVDLGLTAFANSSVHFDQRKKHIAKQAKTMAAHEASLKVAEKKALAQLQKVRATPTTQVQRKQHWFERFNWFISSENYLVISGRDAQQNELIVKRYFDKGDAYVHADLHGAASTIVKNPAPDRPLPPLTLQQAGCACVCRSKAWDSKIVTSAWWVHHQQVSKTAPTGEYLPTGSFMVRGRKNFLPPQPLIFGFGFLFKLEDSCIGAHIGERAVRGGLDGDTTSVAFGGNQGSGNDARDVDIDDFVPEHEDEGKQEDGGSSALDAFMEGGYSSLKQKNQPDSASTTKAPAAGSAKGGKGLSAQAIAAAGVEAPGAAQDVTSQYERYNLQLEVGPDEEAAREEEGAAGAPGTAGAGPGTGKRHMSQKEREMLKKEKLKAQKAQEAAAKGEAQREQRQQQQQQQQQQRQSSKKEGQAKQQQGLANQAKKQAAQQQAQQAQQLEAAARGKKAKLARVKEKYADQDEEERQLALSMLGSAGEKKSRTDRRKERKSKKEASRHAGQSDVVGLEKSAMEEAIQKATSRQFNKQQQQDEDASSGGSSDEGGEEEQAQQTQQKQQNGGPQGDGSGGSMQVESEQSTQTRGMGEGDGGCVSSGGQQQQQPQQQQEGDQKVDQKDQKVEQKDQKDQKGGEEEEEDNEPEVPPAPMDDAEREEVRALLAEENIAMLADEDKEKLTVLDSLTGCPRPEDTLLFALPVCAPYPALQNYKFKVKLVPGTTKKGKAAKQSMELLARSPEATSRERDLIRAVPELSMINAMVGMVKISVPGIQKLRQDDKKTRKQNAKAKANSALDV